MCGTRQVRCWTHYTGIKDTLEPSLLACWDYYTSSFSPQFQFLDVNQWVLRWTSLSLIYLSYPEGYHICVRLSTLYTVRKNILDNQGPLHRKLSIKLITIITYLLGVQLLYVLVFTESFVASNRRKWCGGMHLTSTLSPCSAPPIETGGLVCFGHSCTVRSVDRPSAL